MKKYVITFLCLLCSITNISLEKQIYDGYFVKYRNFLSAYKHIRKWEGNYSNLPFDKGGETYGGITKNFNPNWIGWEELEKYKKDSTIRWNQFIPSVEEHVREYYFSIWLNDGYHKIKDPLVANYVFDYRNTGTIALKHIQQVLNYHGYNIQITKKMDDQTISAINEINPIVFILHLQEVRKEFYNSVADRNPDLERYLNGWINRANYISS